MPDVLTSSITRRAAGPTDEPFLRGLFAESRPDLDLLPPQTRDVLIDMQYRAQRAQYATTFPQARNEIIVVDGDDVGQLMVDDAADGLRVVDITVVLSHRGRGIGSAVLGEVIAHACGRPVRLSVWAGNSGARRLYARLGFHTLEQTEHDGYLQLQYTTTGEAR